jgi:hypothetical protein
VAQSHFAYEFLESIPMLGRGARAPLIVVNCVNALNRPAERDSVSA